MSSPALPVDASAGAAEQASQWLFVYFKVAAEQLPAYWDASERLMQMTASFHPLASSRLMRRPGEAAGLVTVMEMYGPVRANAPDALQAALSAGLAADPIWSDIRRHTEWFVESPCV